MLKYLMLTKRAFLAAIAYRSEVIVWIIIDAMPVVVLGLVWSAIYNGQETLQGLRFSEIIVYYFLILVIGNCIGSNFEGQRVQEIKEGKLDFYLTRPITYLGEVFFSALGYRLFYLVACLPVIFAVFFCIYQYAHLQFPVFTLVSLLHFFALLVFGYLLEFSLAMIIVLLGFWLEGADGLVHFKWIVVSIFSGYTVPLVFMPSWLQSVSNVLPFRYMYSFPIEVILGKRYLSTVDVLYMTGVIFILFLVINRLYSQAKMVYSSYGG